MNIIHKNTEGNQPLCGRVPAKCSPQNDTWEYVDCKYCLRKRKEFDEAFPK